MMIKIYNCLYVITYSSNNGNTGPSLDLIILLILTLMAIFDVINSQHFSSIIT